MSTSVSLLAEKAKRPKSFSQIQCDFCGKKFAYAKRLNSHIMKEVECKAHYETNQVELPIVGKERKRRKVEDPGATLEENEKVDAADVDIEDMDKDSEEENQEEEILEAGGEEKEGLDETDNNMEEDFNLEEEEEKEEEKEEEEEEEHRGGGTTEVEAAPEQPHSSLPCKLGRVGKCGHT